MESLNQNVVKPFRTTNRDVQLFANDTDIGAKTDRSKRYIFIIHGWLFNRNVQWVQDMVRDFIQYVPGVNVCTVDWGKLAYYEYDIAATQNVYSVGRFLEEAINKWKIRPYNVSLVGHTLGAHIAGITGKYLDDSIGKIFAIDPAGPLFCHPNVVDKRSRLTKTDAEYVQVIMTTGGFSGCGIESGIQTFRPAGGVVQPACTGPNFDTIDTEVCSHLIGTEYFRASLQESNTFTAKECESWFLYAVGLCKDAHQDKMGYYAKGLPGDFYLDIGKQEPFSLS